MGKTATRIGLGVATMGLSEVPAQFKSVADGGQALAQGKDPVKALSESYQAGTSLPGSPSGPPDVAASSGNVGQFPDAVKAAAAAAASTDDEDPLNRVRRRASTLLTGGLGVSDSAPVVKKTLLGN